MPEYALDMSLAKETRAQLDDFTFAYIEAAMWTLTAEDGHSLDYLGLHDIAAEAITRMVADCIAFQTTHAALLAQAGTEAQNGHDYWLTRNGHGAGYWDRGYPDAISDALTEAAQADGECYGYVGDDGLVYFD